MKKNRLCSLLMLIVLATGGAAMAADLTPLAPEILEKVQAALPRQAAAEPQQPRRLLVFTKTNGFRHASIAVGVQTLAMMGETTGAFQAVHSEDESMFEPEQLRQFDAVLMLNTSGDVFLPKQLPDEPSQRREAREREEQLKQSLVAFVRGGKGLAGIHAATDTYKNWQAYNDMMGGAFMSHPWHTEVPVRVLDPAHPLLQVFGGKGFTVVDEIYQFRNDTAAATERRMLLSLAPDWEGLAKGSREDDFYPISWIDRYGQGRVFYCSLGHRDEIYHHRDILAHYLAGLQFALGDLQADAEPIDVKP